MSNFMTDMLLNGARLNYQDMSFDDLQIMICDKERTKKWHNDDEREIALAIMKEKTCTHCDGNGKGLDVQEDEDGNAQEFSKECGWCDLHEVK